MKYNLGHLVKDGKLYGVDLVRPLFYCNITSAMATVFLLELQNLVDLIDAALDCAVN